MKLKSKMFLTKIPMNFFYKKTKTKMKNKIFEKIAMKIPLI